MHTKHEILTRLQEISSEELGVPREQITEESTWTQLGADSLDRLQMSRAIEDALKVEIPPAVGERLNTVGQTVDHLLGLIAKGREVSIIRIEAVTTDQQWIEMLGIRTQVFTIEHGFSFRHLPGPGETGVWHFLARDKLDPIGTLTIVDTTGDQRLHRCYRLSFAENDRVARYAQLAILKPYRKRGIFEMLIKAAQSTIIRHNGFEVEWLLYPCRCARSSKLTQHLGFIVEAPVLITEFGLCHVLTRRELDVVQGNRIEKSSPILESCAV